MWFVLEWFSQNVLKQVPYAYSYIYVDIFILQLYRIISMIINDYVMSLQNNINIYTIAYRNISFQQSIALLFLSLLLLNVFPFFFVLLGCFSRFGKHCGNCDVCNAGKDTVMHICFPKNRGTSKNAVDDLPFNKLITREVGFFLGNKNIKQWKQHAVQRWFWTSSRTWHGTAPRFQTLIRKTSMVILIRLIRWHEKAHDLGSLVFHQCLRIPFEGLQWPTACFFEFPILLDLAVSWRAGASARRYSRSQGDIWGCRHVRRAWLGAARCSDHDLGKLE